MEFNYIKQLYYIIFHRINLIIIIKEIIIIIFYYLFYILNYYYALFNINEFYLYIINILLLYLLLIRLFIAHNYFINTKQNINKLYNLFNKLLLFYIVVFQEDNINEDADIDDIDDIDSIDENNTNNKITHYNNIYYNFNNINTNFNIQKDSIIFNENVNEIKNLLLIYITYLFTNCKFKHNNFISYSTVTLKDISTFEQFINNEINKIYYNFNINNEQFKINYLEFNIINNFNKLYKENHLSINNFNKLLKYFKKIQAITYKILFNLDNDNILFKLINYIFEILIFINIISLIIYFNKNASNIGIVFILIINYFYFYINSIIYIQLNCFNCINLNKNKSFGINLDDYLHKLYDEFNIIININLYEKYYIK